MQAGDGFEDVVGLAEIGRWFVVQDARVADLEVAVVGCAVLSGILEG